MFSKKKISYLLMVYWAVHSVLFSTNIHFKPGIVSVCFSYGFIGNTRGEFEITIDDGVVITPHPWLNELSTEFQFVNMY